MRRTVFLSSCVVIAILLMTGWAYAATFTVDNPGDLDDGLPYTPFDGTNTLRKCIRLANNNFGGDLIDFAVSGVIFPGSPLPVIGDDGTIIDASSQWIGLWPAGQPGIILDGAGAGAGAEGLTIFEASDCQIRGLFITNFGGKGVLIFGGAQFNTIGGAGVGERNVISGNGEYGIEIREPATGNMILGNYIGTDVTGTIDLGNADNGITIAGEVQATIIGGTTPGERNVISGNGWCGVDIIGLGIDNIVSGNHIGTDVTGTAALGNAAHGVCIRSGAKSNIVGGTTAGERNIISGNGRHGVEITGLGTDSNKLSGNYIGTDVTGNADLGNSWNVECGRWPN